MKGRTPGSKNLENNISWESLIFNVTGLKEFEIDKNKEYIDYICRKSEYIRFNKNLTIEYYINGTSIPLQTIQNYYVLFRYLNKLISDKFDYQIIGNLRFMEAIDERNERTDN